MAPATPADPLAGLDLTVYCSYRSHPRRPALYKLAAAWSGGGYRELKTFGFADDECLERLYHDARRRAATLALGPEEELGPIRVYRLQPTLLDRALAVDEAAEARLGITAP